MSKCCEAPTELLQIETKLHLGCGDRRLPGFIHIDQREFPDVKVANVACLASLYQDNTIDLIYCSCLFEHFKRNDAPAILRHWRDLLKPSGTLRLSVPDFRTLAKLYVGGVALWRVIGPICGRQNADWNIHYSVYDKEYLSWLLTEAGFYHIREWSPYDTSKLPADYDDYSKATIDNQLITLNLEATA